jgi:2-polyprenyl-3-methyl-5-hydroxy-6-metoxy-1,4-benzoquinol methylase
MQADRARRHDDIRDFYDAFLESRMLAYRLDGPNQRLAKAIDRVAGVTRPNDRVLDLGCGIGLVVEELSARLGHNITVFACDISPRNIWYARKTIPAPNITFFEADLLTQFDQVSSVVGVGRADVISLIDVIEHIPRVHHASLLRDVSRVARPGARLVLTYPSPLYQEYLRTHQPSELQIVDETVLIGDLIEAAARCGFLLKHYSIEDVWMQNQYVHAVFHHGLALAKPASPRHGLWARGTKQVQGLLGRCLRPYRRWKYVRSVFK